MTGRGPAAPLPDVLAETLDEHERDLVRWRDPEFVEPMLATLTREHFSDPGWVFERKLDGERLVVVRDEHGTSLFTRNHKQVAGTYPELVEALDARAAPGLVADGEVVAFDGAQTSFSRLQGRLGSPTRPGPGPPAWPCTSTCSTPRSSPATTSPRWRCAAANACSSAACGPATRSGSAPTATPTARPTCGRPASAGGKG